MTDNPKSQTTDPTCSTCAHRGCPTPVKCVEIARLRALLREADAATAFMPTEWKQRAKELGV